VASELATRAKAPNFIAQRLSGFEAATERGADAFTRGIRLKARFPGLKSGATHGPAFFRSFVFLDRSGREF
jgi:hypothetical protein